MTPLSRRLPRELRHNIGKYLGIFLLMCGSIALTSGFLLAAHSIGCIIDNMRDEYTIEDGRVITAFEATDDQVHAAEDAAEGVGGVTLYKNFSIDTAIKKPVGDDGTKRAPHRGRPRVLLRRSRAPGRRRGGRRPRLCQEQRARRGRHSRAQRPRLHHLRHHDPAR